MQPSRPAFRFPYAFVFAVFVAGCSGDGCGCTEPIPGGFPDEARTQNGVQIRVTDTGLAAIEADPAGILGGLTGGGLTFEVPPSCGGNPEICCAGGTPTTPCGPIELDLEARSGDAPRMELTPISGSDRVDIIVRARVRTLADMPIDAGIACDVAIDTTQAGVPSITILAQAQFSQDASAGTTVIDVGNISVNDFDNGDLDLKPGNFLCIVGDLFAKGLVVDQLVTALEDNLSGIINDQLCKACPSGDVADCGAHADACTDNVCMNGDMCVQQLGIAGRMRGEAVLGATSPGTMGAMDVYEVAGGYATSEQDGVALGMLSGMMPAGDERDRCGPPATPPAAVTIPQSSFFQGNTRPDTGNAFDIGIGIHQHNLDLLAYAAYDGGLLCLNIGTRTVDLLTSETMAVIMPSFIDMLHGKVGQMVLGLRPQSPPAIVLGPGTFATDGTIDQPLLDITFSAMEIDFYGMVDDAFIRLMTLTADINLPLNLDVDENGDLLPVLGDVDNAFTNLSVSNAGALSETPDELANKVPALLSLALPLIGDSLGSFALPEIGGLKLEFQPDGITSVDNNTFIGIFANFVLASSMRASAAEARVETYAELVELAVPDAEAFARLDRSRRPVFVLRLDGASSSSSDLEWSVRLDGGMWGPYRTDRQRHISRDSLWLPGRHTVEVRARQRGAPLTTDLTPTRIDAMIAPRRVDVDPKAPRDTRRGHGGIGHNSARADGAGPTDPALIGFHGSSGGSGGCACDSGASSTPSTGTLALSLLCLGFLFARRRRSATSLAPLALERTARALGVWCQTSRRCASDASPPAAFLVGRGPQPTSSSCLAGGAPRNRRSVPFNTILLVAAMVIFTAGALPACDCGGTTAGPCAAAMGECIDGEVERGPIGRWASIAVGSERTVVAAYEQDLGDLVLIDLADDGDLTYRVIDGVPTDTLPVFDPSTYRKGVVEPGANVGAWTSIALVGNLVRVAYQDIDASTLKFVAETEGTGFFSHIIDSGDAGGASTPGSAGLYASLAYDPSGIPAVAYMAWNVREGGGQRKAQLRYARANGPNPAGGGDWTISVLDDVEISCAGLCDDGSVCAPAGEAEQCMTPTNDCAAPCSDTEACLNGTCTAFVPDPPAHQPPQGVGLFANLDFLPDGRPVVVYYDGIATDLMMQVGDASGVWTTSTLSGDATGDTGMFADMVIDDAGTVHVAFQDALRDILLYTSWSNGEQQGTEIVDNGVRSGDRPHPVGAHAALILGGSTVAIAYQDAATSDLVLSTQGGTDQWTRSDLLTGDTVDGSFAAAAWFGRTRRVASYRYDRSFFPPGELVITTIP